MANAGNDIVLPPEYSGPAQLLLYTRYGNPRDIAFENKWIYSWNVQDAFPWFPVQKLRIHKHFWPLLDAAFKELELYNLHDEIKGIGDCYSIHTINETQPLLSMHSWGAALDMHTNPDALLNKAIWSNDFIEIMEKHAIHCGQKWAVHAEPHHFAMVNG